MGERSGFHRNSRSFSSKSSELSNLSLSKSSHSPHTPGSRSSASLTKNSHSYSPILKTNLPIQFSYGDSSPDDSQNHSREPLKNNFKVRSPKVSLSSPSETEISLSDHQILSPRSPNISEKSPKKLFRFEDGNVFSFENVKQFNSHVDDGFQNISKKSTTHPKVNVGANTRHLSFRIKKPKPDGNPVCRSPTASSENEPIRPKLLRYRKSTSDLTELSDDACNTTITPLSRPTSPRRKNSVKGGLAYLASRRESRDSIASNTSNEDIGPLNLHKNPRARQRRTSNFLELPVPDHIRPRVSSLPEKAFNPRLSDDLYRLRTFSITNKGGVVNCGDSIINRRSRSNTSVNSTTSRASNVSGERSPFEGSCCGSGYQTVESSPVGTPEEIEVPKYRVVMLGDSGVGKTALVSQFMTSEYMNTYDASLDDEFGERTVSILLDGEETEMVFIDHPSSEMSVENSLSTYEPHACIVVYSIIARSSFQNAEDILNYLWREGFTKDKSVIVVGNKADLARSRAISQNDGKALAVSRDCKFIETSSGIQHNVDELLVGILKQIRLRETWTKKKNIGKKERNKLNNSKTSLSLNIAKEILQKICMNDISKSKSCENLHVL